MALEDYDLDPTPAASGAQGNVYFGVRRADGLKVAVKVATSQKSAVRSLEREIELVRSLASEGVGGIVECLDTVTHGGLPGMVMRHYPHHMGQFLNQAVTQPDGQTLTAVLGMCSSLAYTLGRIHRTKWQGGTVVHRDVKPENVFLDQHGAAYIGDFGGAMAIGGLERVEVTLFGTPMWAPLDQILPGQTIPDPTWDTYALCVFLYAAMTGARPAYQSDPRTLLTDAGRDLWEVGRKAIEGPREERREWARHFARMRTGARANDLIDVTGHGALVAADRQALDHGVRRLAQLSGLDARSARSISRGLWDLLGRGLSPVSHPSPPNRYRDGLELGELLEELRDRARPVRTATPPPARARRSQPIVPMSAALSADLKVPPASSLSGGLSGLALVGVGLVGLVGLGAAAAFFREPLMAVAFQYIPQASRAHIAPGSVDIDGVPHSVGAFLLDRTEARVQQYRACEAAGACPPHELGGGDNLPVVGLDADQARALCQHLGARLPTRAEWVLAAGPDPMPWGTAPPTCKRGIALGCGGEIQPVGTAWSGATTAGVLDLAGNAWEWVEGDEGPLLMGGGAQSPASQLGVQGVLTPDEGGVEPHAGVRCATEAANQTGA